MNEKTQNLVEYLRNHLQNDREVAVLNALVEVLGYENGFESFCKYYGYDRDGFEKMIS